MHTSAQQVVVQWNYMNTTERVECMQIAQCVRNRKLFLFLTIHTVFYIHHSNNKYFETSNCREYVWSFTHSEQGTHIYMHMHMLTNIQIINMCACACAYIYAVFNVLRLIYTHVIAFIITIWLLVFALVSCYKLNMNVNFIVQFYLHALNHLGSGDGDICMCVCFQFFLFAFISFASVSIYFCFSSPFTHSFLYFDWITAASVFLCFTTADHFDCRE